MEKMIRDGYEMLDNQMYQTAIGYFNQALEDDPDCLEALWGLGRALMESGSYLSAIPPLSAVFRLGDSTRKQAAALKIGSCFSRIGRFSEASEWFYKAASIDSNQPHAYAQLSWHCFTFQRYSDSDAFAQRALEMDADYLPAYGVKALTAIANGKLSEAETYLNHLVAHSASDSIVAFVRGWLFEAKGCNEEAIRAYSQVVRSDTEGSLTYDRLAHCLYRVGRAEEARATLEQLLEARPNDYTSYFYLGRHFMRVHSNVQALRLFEKALELNPHHPFLYFSAAVACIRLFRFRKSADYLETAIELYEMNRLDNTEDYYNSLSGAIFASIMCLRWKRAIRLLNKMKTAVKIRDGLA